MRAHSDLQALTDEVERLRTRLAETNADVNAFRAERDRLRAVLAKLHETATCGIYECAACAALRARAGMP